QAGKQRIGLAASLHGGLRRGEAAISRRRGDFHSRSGLHGLSPSDAKNPLLVRGSPSARSLSGVEARALGSPESLIAKLWVCDLRLAHNAQQLLNRLKRFQSFVGHSRPVCHRNVSFHAWLKETLR